MVVGTSPLAFVLLKTLALVVVALDAVKDDIVNPSDCVVVRVKENDVVRDVV